ncbi:MAG: LamG domain-containing protein [Deltaproteobacteria bacterium]|nr:LamG domain-containing protein [Deltaproteobacteria bacterium]
MQVAVLFAGCGRIGFSDVTRDAARDATHDGATCATCDQGLVARWRLDEGGGTIAHDDIGGHDGTLQLAGTWGAAGVVGGALSLQHGYVQSTWNLPAAAPSAFTVAMWVNVDPVQTQPYDRFFSSFFFTNATGDGGALLMDNYSSDGLRCAPYIGGAFHYLEIDHVITLGTWQHIACIYDGLSVTEYVQAAPVGMLAASGTFGESKPYPVVIGASVDDMANWENEAYMLVDDVRVYDRALTQAELSALASP